MTANLPSYTLIHDPSGDFTLGMQFYKMELFVKKDSSSKAQDWIPDGMIVKRRICQDRYEYYKCVVTHLKKSQYANWILLPNYKEPSPQEQPKTAHKVIIRQKAAIVPSGIEDNS